MILAIGVYLITGILATSIYSIGVSIKFYKMADGDMDEYFELIEDFLGRKPEKVFNEIKSYPLPFLFRFVIWPYRLAKAISAAVDFCRKN